MIVTEGDTLHFFSRLIYRDYRGRVRWFLLAARHVPEVAGLPRYRHYVTLPRLHFPADYAACHWLMLPLPAFKPLIAAHDIAARTGNAQPQPRMLIMMLVYDILVQADSGYRVTDYL